MSLQNVMETGMHSMLFTFHVNMHAGVSIVCCWPDSAVMCVNAAQLKQRHELFTLAELLFHILPDHGSACLLLLARAFRPYDFLPRCSTKWPTLFIYLFCEGLYERVCFTLLHRHFQPFPFQCVRLCSSLCVFAFIWNVLSRVLQRPYSMYSV